MTYTALRLDLAVDMGSCSSYSMSISKFREGSGATDWILNAVALGRREGFPALYSN